MFSLMIVYVNVTRPKWQAAKLSTRILKS